MRHQKPTMWPTVDYITLTTKEEELAGEWYTVYGELCKSQELRHEEQREIMWFGFLCITIPGKILWGQRDDGHYILQGVSAWADIIWHLVGWKTGVQATRIDLACTATLAEPINIASKLYEVLIGSSAIPLSKLTLMQSRGGGTTLYIGSSKSEQYGRIYDKGIQSGTAGKHELWRYEVVLKKPRSLPAVQELAKGMDEEGHTDKMRRKIASYVCHWFADRGATPFWANLISEEGSLRELSVQYTVSTPARKLAWIREQVRPSVLYLLGQGFEEEVQEALGYRVIPAMEQGIWRDGVNGHIVKNLKESQRNDAE